MEFHLTFVVQTFWIIVEAKIQQSQSDEGVQYCKGGKENFADLPNGLDNCPGC